MWHGSGCRKWQEPVQGSKGWFQQCPVVKKMGRHSCACCVSPSGSSLEAGFIIQLTAGVSEPQRWEVTSSDYQKVASST